MRILIQLKKIISLLAHFLRKKMDLAKNQTLVMLRVEYALISLELFGDLIKVQEQDLGEIRLQRAELIKHLTIRITRKIIQ